MTLNEIEKWIANEILHFHENELSQNYMVDRIIYWRFSEIACHLIRAEPNYFDDKIKILKQFWDYVIFYRKKPTKLENLIKYVEEMGKSKSADIFTKVHKDYLSVHKDTAYQPLYQKEKIMAH